MGARASAGATMRGVLSGATVLALGASGGAAGTIAAQGALREARTITATPVEFPEPFSAVTRMVELRDGRVLLFDQRERRLSLLDLAGGTSSAVSRRGEGPLEYRSVGSLHRVAGDSILLWDAGNRRMLFFSPDGRPVRTEAFDRRAALLSGLVQPEPLRIDDRGRWYLHDYDFSAGSRRLGARATTNVAIVRLDPRTGRRDSLGVISQRLPPATSFRDGVLTLRSWGFIGVDAWGVYPDGRLLIVRGTNYVPETADGPGGTRPQAAVAYTRHSVTQADRDAHLEATRGEAGATRMISNTGQTVGFRAAAQPPEAWQEEHPPLLAEDLAVDTRARAWVHVFDPKRAEGERYDLLDRDGRLVDAIRLPKGTKFVAMGTNVWYGTREDEDGLVYLQRFPLP